jgi:hypothetical protein
MWISSRDPSDFNSIDSETDRFPCQALQLQLLYNSLHPKPTLNAAILDPDPAGQIWKSQMSFIIKKMNMKQVLYSTSRIPLLGA